MNAHITGNDLKQAESGEKISLGGKEYSLVMDFNAICDIEEKYGSLEKGMDEIGKGKMKDVRFLLAAMLKHDDDEMNERKAGKLITTENMQEIFDALGKAMSGSMPQPNGTEKKAESPQEM
jgi:hypothetical protein